MITLNINKATLSTVRVHISVPTCLLLFELIKLQSIRLKVWEILVEYAIGWILINKYFNSLKLTHTFISFSFAK